VACRLLLQGGVTLRALPCSTVCLCLLASSCSHVPSLVTSSEKAPARKTVPRNSLETFEPGCTDSLEQLLEYFPCPGTYAAATDGPNQLCRDYEDRFEVTSGPSHSFITYLYGAGETDCVYDASSSGLVGMRVSDDSNYFCKGTSSVVEAGDLGEAEWAPETFRRIDCKDSDLAPPVGSPSPVPRACPGGSAPSFLVRPGIHSINSFTLSATDLYWAESDGIWHAPKEGGYGLPVIEDGYAARVVGSDAEALYWSRPPEWSSPPALYRLPFESRAEPQLVAQDASHVWAISGSQIYYLSSAGQLRSVPTAGGASMLLAAGPWSSQALAVDATGVYFYDERASTAAEPLSKYSFASGSVSAFAPVAGGAQFVQIAGEHVIWADAAGVWSSSSNGERSSLSSATSVRGLASDGTSVYWAESSGPEDVFSDVLRLPLAGGVPETVACHVYAVRSLRADGAAVYYDATVGDVLGKITLE
jgi:hypothetical protein